MWVAHLEANGFTVTTKDLPDLRGVKSTLEVPPMLSSCHTAVVDGYVVEGHVPAEDIKRMLADRPDIEGIAVPGMPIGSPGMEGPNGRPYDVISFDEDGGLERFARHTP